MLITEDQKNELNDWLRPHSRLVTFARSLRMEDPPREGGNPDDAKPKEPSLLDGIDLDNVPEDIRKILVDRDTEFKANKVSLTKSEQDKQQLIETARNHQSRADRFHGVLQAHNLNPDTKPLDNKEENTYLLEIKNSLMQDGMKPELAEGYAKILAKAGPIIAAQASKQLATSIAPMVAVVGDMKADQTLHEARSEKNDPNGLFEIPEVFNLVAENLKHIASVGGPTDLNTIINLRDMAYGKHIQTNPEARRSGGISLTTRLSGMGGGGNPIQPRNNGRIGEAQAANEETARAVDSTLSMMLKGIKRK